MAISSINIQLAKLFAFFHNTRESIVSYVIVDSSRNDYDRNGKKAYTYYRKLLSESTSNYTKRTKQRIQTKQEKFLWEAVINLNTDHSLNDLKLLRRILRVKYGWQAVQTVIHYDEGHADKESGENIYNYHAHIVFFMLDKNGIYRFKKRDFGIKRMEELQTLVASILKMERGKSKKHTNRVRLNHRQYRQVIQEKEKMQNIINELKAEVSDKNMEIFDLAIDFSEYENQEIEHQLEVDGLEKKIQDGLVRVSKLKKLVYSEEWKVKSYDGKDINEKNVNVVHYLEKEVEDLKKLNDKQKISISKMEDKIQNVQNDLLKLNGNGKIEDISLLEKYFPVDGITSDKMNQKSNFLSFEEDGEYNSGNDYDLTKKI